MSGAKERPVRQAELSDGSRLHVIDGSPASLPPVQARDLRQAWEAAHGRAREGGWGVARVFRFVAGEQSRDIALADPDASSWAEAVAGRADLCTRYGMSLCLRLLALVDLLGRPGASRWARRLVHLEDGEAELHPALLAFAACAALNMEARFADDGALAAIGGACDLLPQPEGRLP